MQTNKTRILNVYLTNADRKELTKIKEKYHLSYSTIASIIVGELVRGSWDKLWDHYIYKEEKSTKTSIKPRNYNNPDSNVICEFKDGRKIKTTLIYTNAIKTFTHNEIAKNLGIDEKEAEKRRSRIFNAFSNTYDPNWNGNQLSRFIPKFIRQNKAYVKKVLEE